MIAMQKNYVTFIVLILSFMLISCSGANDAPETVTFMVFGDPPEQDVYKSVVAAFEEKNPDINIDLIGLPSKPDYLTRLSTDFAAGSPPDVFLLNYRQKDMFFT